MSNEPYFVALPTDYQTAIREGLRVIGLNYRIFSDSTLKRASSAVLSAGDIMGITDVSMEQVPQKIDCLTEDIIYEVSLRKCSGILFDFEHSSNAMYPFVSNLSYILNEHNIQHYVPARFHSAAPNAYLIAECSVSGGSVEHFYHQVTENMPKDRLAFQINAMRMDFKMPSYTSQGKILSKSNLESIVQQYRPSIFFSNELMCKYFTYQCSDGSFHFVLFDDKSTIREKINFFQKNGCRSSFILYSDWNSL